MDQLHESSSDASAHSSNVVEKKAISITAFDEKIPTPPEPPTEDVSSEASKKANAIRRACDLRDLNALVAYATTEGGLLHDGLRQLAWPIFLWSDRSMQYHDMAGWKDWPRHEDEGQVQLDVERSFVYYPRGTDKELSARRLELSRLITRVLRKYPMLSYFQGYHDIAQVLLLVLGEEKATSAVAQVSLFRIRDYMLPSLAPALKHLGLIPAIIETADPMLAQHLSGVQPFFALASTLTLYAHDIEEYGDIARLFDFLLAHEPVISLYVFAAIILLRKNQLLEIPMDEPDMLHFTLAKLPYPLDLERLILRALELFKDHPPETLPSRAWKRISAYSVLKTSRNPFRESTIAEATNLFEKQTRQLRNEELREKSFDLMWRHRKTISSVAVAVLFAAASFWIREKGYDTPIWSSISALKSTIFGHD